MNIFGIHVCQQELQAIAMALPFVGLACYCAKCVWTRLRRKK